MGAVTKRRSTKAEAKARADNIRHHAESLRGLLLAAWENDDHLALGYETWHAYVQGEFDMTRTHAYRLLDQARITLAIEEAVHDAAPNNTNADGAGPESGVDLLRGVTPGNRMQRNRINPVVTTREARVLRRDIPKVAEEVAQDVKQGAPVQEAVRAAVARRTPAQALPAGSWRLPAAEALLAIDPTTEGKRAGRPGLATARQVRAWADRFEGAIKGAQPIVTQAECLHPSTRRIGQGRGACGKEKV